MLEELRKKFSGSVEIDVPLSRYTYYRIGGPARAVVTPKTEDDLILIHHFLQQQDLPFFILGWGSNLLFSDDGFAGLVIRMKHFENDVSVLGPDRIQVGASVGGSTLLRKAQDLGWGNLAQLTGIPGSVGGMIAMNAGTHLGEMKDCCDEIQIVKLGRESQKSDLEVVTIKPDSNSFSYRKNHFLGPQDLILRAKLRTQPADPLVVKEQINDLYRRRKETQPVDFPSCGSVFKNPHAHGMRAWQVIDQLGFRGKILGGAQVSEKHPNFIINRGNANAADVKELIRQIQVRALDEMGIVMEPEVKIL